MNFNGLKQIVTSNAGRTVLKLQKHSPQILFGAGVVSFVGTAVLTAKATLNLEDVLDNHESNMKTRENLMANDPKYTEKMYNKDGLFIYAKTGLHITKMYAPAIAMAAFSIGCFTASHNILNKRNVAISAAYAGIDKAFKEYRERVVADVGEDKDKEYRYGLTEREVIVETETGPQVQTIKTVDGTSHSMYAAYFGADSKEWSPRPDYNYRFLKAQQNYMNDLLRNRGHVFLNEVHDALGMPRTTPGQVVGWLYDGTDGCYIDFGLDFNDGEFWKPTYQVAHNNAILLDFNVDGEVFRSI